MNHFSESRVNTNHNVTCAPSLAENDSRLLKNSEGNRNGELIFCRRKEADDALFLQVTSMRKIIKFAKQTYAPINGLPQDGGGGGNPRELDSVKRTCVGNLTS